jgi:hypothetical protein
MEGRGPAPFGGGGYVPGGGGMYCGAREEKQLVRPPVITGGRRRDARGICGIGDAAYIAIPLISYHSETGEK